MADNRDELISQFADVTGVHPDRAKFYLESAAWQLEVAFANFYEQGEPDMEDFAPPASAGGLERTAESAAAKPAKEKSRFATLHTLANEDSSSDEEEHQAFYAGGSERSGQQVLGPPKKQNDFVAEMFKSAKEHAEVIDPSKAAQKKGAHFSGVGYRLGQSSEDTEVVGGASASDDSPKEITLKLWKNGFSVNDEGLRDYSDPANKDFLDSIRRGEMPRELQKNSRGGEVHLSMEDHRHQDYVPAKSSVKAFTGKGMMLGSSPSPPTVGGTQAVSEADREANERRAQGTLEVDESQPITNIQIRLADGSRLVGRFNHTHNVGDLRRFITLARPQYSLSDFSLLTTFPNKELTNETESLKDANLLNAAILQRLK